MAIKSLTKEIGFAAKFRGVLKGTDTRSFSNKIKARRKEIEKEFSERSRRIRLKIHR